MLTLDTSSVSFESMVYKQNKVISEDTIINNIYNFLGENDEESLQKRLKKMVKKATYIECDETSKDIKGSGNFGKVVQKRHSVIKLSNLFKQFSKRVTLNSLYDTSLIKDIEITLNTCESMRKHVQQIRNMFHNNFPPIYSCKLCLSSSKKILFESKLKMTKATDLNKILPSMSNGVLAVIELQLLYIFKTLNYFGIYHNDLAPRNIMISNETRNVTYNQYPDMILKLKNVPVPIIIDFDFLGVRFQPKTSEAGTTDDIDVL
jgi:serine/threonine protein kinase